MVSKITASRAQRLCAPAPFALVTAAKPEGGVNVAAYSWWTFMSNRPPMLGVCTSNAKFTGECIKNSGRFVLCVPGPQLQSRSMACGSISGRGMDKVAGIGLELIELGEQGDMGIVGSQVMFVCKLVDTAQASDHTMYIAQIEEAYEDASVANHLCASKGYSELSVFSAIE